MTSKNDKSFLKLDLESLKLDITGENECVRGQLGRLRSLARPKRPTLTASAVKTQARLM